MVLGGLGVYLALVSGLEPEIQAAYLTAALGMVSAAVYQSWKAVDYKGQILSRCCRGLLASVLCLVCGEIPNFRLGCARCVSVCECLLV